MSDIKLYRVTDKQDDEANVFVLARSHARAKSVALSYLTKQCGNDCSYIDMRAALSTEKWIIGKVPNHNAEQHIDWDDIICAKCVNDEGNGWLLEYRGVKHECACQECGNPVRHTCTTEYRLCDEIIDEISSNTKTDFIVGLHPSFLPDLWQPINTAPPNTAVLLQGKYGMAVGVMNGYWQPVGVAAEDESDCVVELTIGEITQWQPLPKVIKND